jgi:DNA polymerase-3 subunit delta'
VLERTAYGPHEGRARVFIVRQAEELSNSAANALLKTLEEPHQATHFVLLTSRGRKLIDTIRSRTQLVRFAPLPEHLIARILEERGIDAETARTAAELSAGSASLALDLADPELSKEREDFTDAVARAIDAQDLAPALAVAEARSRDKSMLGQRLAALAARYARLGRETLVRDPEGAVKAALRYEIVTRALRELERNASPALLMEAMMMRLRSAV